MATKSGQVFRPGEHPADPKLAELRHELARHLDEIGRLFNHPKLTLLVRAPDLPDGDVLIGDDDFDLAAATIKRHGLAVAGAAVPKQAIPAAGSGAELAVARRLCKRLVGTDLHVGLVPVPHPACRCSAIAEELHLLAAERGGN